MKSLPKVVLLGFSLLLVSVPTLAGKLLEQADVQAFIGEMHDRHGFNLGELERLFAETRVKESIIKAISRPAEKKPWYAYRPIFLTESRIELGIEFWNEHAELLEAAYRQYGVAPEIIVGIIGVETRYGRHKGNYRVMDALATLAFAYPPRAAFFRKELEQYLLMTREEKVDPLALKGSYAGAMGQPQFISSSYRAYAIDFDRDGKRDIWNNPADAIGSVANYLARHGWQRDQSIAHNVRAGAQTDRKLLEEKQLEPGHSIASLRQQGFEGINGELQDDALAAVINLEGKNAPEHWLGLKNFYVITRYNHSALYAMAVYQLGQEIRERRRDSDKNA